MENHHALGIDDREAPQKPPVQPDPGPGRRGCLQGEHEKRITPVRHTESKGTSVPQISLPRMYGLL